MKWYYANNDNQRVGPLSEEAFQRAVQSGQVSENTLVWSQGMGDWQPYSAVAPQVAPAPPPPAPGPEAPSAQPAQDWEAIAQQVKEGVQPGTEASWEFGGFWIRFGAYFIDNLILQAISFAIQFGIGIGLAMLANPDSPVGMLLLVALYLIPLVIVVCYYTYFHGNPNHQATPGKKLMKLRVITADGEDVTYLRAFGRYWAAVLSALILLIGYIMAAFDSEKRALHDHICNTRVIKR